MSEHELHQASREGRVEAVKLLLNAGAKVHLVDNEGHHALTGDEEWLSDECRTLLEKARLQHGRTVKAAKR